jgi:predicted dehydrogenase
VLIEYPRFQSVCQWRECAAGATNTGLGGLEFQGTKGTIVLGRTGFELVPDKKDDPANIVARIIGGHPVGGPQSVGGPTNQFWTEKLTDKSGNANDQYVQHVRNFLDCVKSRKDPVSDIESGHEVATVCHLANISLRSGRKLRWDAEREQIAGDAEAAAMLSRPYRKPWDGELKALGAG